ncbi:MAG: hypothetical protein PF501_18810 [Salinisphaera sp.]|jgi:phosphomevalonate kinase|nr:hypothetical protein [Salinisphaera sp.]
MPSTIKVSAPGKLFLIGEYAVLDGAPALLTAVDRRARVQLSPSQDGQWHLRAANLGIDDIALGPDGALPTNTSTTMHDRLRVFDAVCRAIREQVGTALPALQIDIDSSDFARGGHKLGLGSSAAVAAALTHALGLAAGQDWSQARLAQMAIDAHRAAQNGTGSGGDVAASVYGGLISYTRDRPPTPLPWPDAVRGMAVVTGDGASTTDLVARVRRLAKRDERAYHEAIDRLAALADKAQHSLADSERFLQLADDYFQALAALDELADAGIVSPRHQQLHQLAASHRAVFKSSGAGGGDVGLLFVRTGDDERAVRRAFTAADAHILPLQLCAAGVRAEKLS